MIYVSELKKEYFTTGDIAKLVGLNYRTVALHQKRKAVSHHLVMGFEKQLIK